MAEVGGTDLEFHRSCCFRRFWNLAAQQVRVERAQSLGCAGKFQQEGTGQTSRDLTVPKKMERQHYARTRSLYACGYETLGLEEPNKAERKNRLIEQRLQTFQALFVVGFARKT